MLPSMLRPLVGPMRNPTSPDFTDIVSRNYFRLQELIYVEFCQLTMHYVPWWCWQVLARDSPLKPDRQLVKPSRDQLTGSLDASQFTADEPNCALDSNVLTVAREPCIPVSFHDVVGSGVSGALDSVVKRQCPVDRGLRARSYPPAGKLPAVVDDWLGLAPLASPETLSESSSLVSCGSNNVAASLGYQRIMSSILPPRMDPILQSPARSSNSRDCGLYLESANVVGDLAALSPCVENLPSPIAPRHHNPDIVPVPPFVSNGSSGGSSTVAVHGSSPDVVQEIRSTSVPGGGQQCERCCGLCVDCRHNFTCTDVSSSHERGACACDMSQPDIVTTHDIAWHTIWLISANFAINSKKILQYLHDIMKMTKNHWCLVLSQLRFMLIDDTVHNCIRLVAFVSLHN